MSSRPRRVFSAALSILTVALAGAALAWACTPQASIGISNNTGPPGTTITITGKVFEPGGPVQIFWNGSGGSQLAAATGPEFSVTATIPDAPPDTYTIYAVGRSANGAVAGRASASFTIPGPAPDDERAPAPSPNVPSSPASGTTTGAGTSANGEATTRGARGGEGVRARGESRIRAGAPARTGIPAAVRTTSSGRSVFADSLAPARAAKVAVQAKGRTKGSAGHGTASERSAAGDLWSGFGSGTARASLGRTASQAETPGSMPVLATALLAIGLLSLIAGVAVAAARRRHSPARAQGQTHTDND